MMKKNRWLLILIGLVGSLSGQPRIESTNGTEHNFGEIYQGKVVKHTFVLKNSGTDTLFILRVQAFCGCTTSPWRSTYILPGKTKDLELTFRTSGFQGRERKTIAVASSDPVIPVLNLILLANIIVEVEANPPYFLFQNLKIGKKSKSMVTLINRSTKPVRLIAAESHDPNFTVEFKPMILPPQQSTKIIGELIPKTTEVVNSEVYIQIDNTRQPVIEVRLTYIAQP